MTKWLDISFGIYMKLQKYIWISRVGEWMKCMSNLADKFVPRITFAQIIASFVVEKKYKYLSLTGS